MELTKDLAGLVSDWPQVRRTLVFTFCFFLILFGGVWISLYIFKQSGVSIQSTLTGTSITFAERNRRLTFDTVLISPQDWNDPRISVEKGDVIAVTAFGKVNVAMGLMNRRLRIQDEYRELNRSSGKSRDVGDMSETQITESLLIVPWNGPEGFDPSSVTDNAVRETQDRQAGNRIIPNEKMGRLIAAIVPGDKCPSRGETRTDFQLVPYYSNRSFTAEINGNLCFIVNDHRGKNDNENQLLWDDNIGFFGANIKVESK